MFKLFFSSEQIYKQVYYKQIKYKFFYNYFKMTEVDRVKLAVKTLISLGVAKNQEEIGKLMGYSNKSSFSQVLNGIVPLPDKFIDKLCRLDKRLRRDWIVNEFGHILIKNNNSKQVYIDKNIDTYDKEEGKGVEIKKTHPYNNNFQYRELAESRLETINTKDKLIEVLEKNIIQLEAQLNTLTQNKSFKRGEMNSEEISTGSDYENV
ncbi:hypothetical protein FPG101_08630 [Flavobacterium psychrophilum FPG101]|nr:hypothetical protein FPG101_08630 [Flavobacterium psychrophilum FPG101]KUM16475.1 hypothetical protein ATB91_04530 [Flavobacterium psychrophilum]KUM19723.1 hypothetical protein AS885_08315 [Flavobacterium psychrophilum]KUM21480.1 hypothetical protein ATB90_10950 [Flavobacterium psychrophilum]OJH12712.1 hypothetical protein FPG103_07945 [Flavobacterium psychrophilum]